jgi:hypothetical protein
MTAIDEYRLFKVRPGHVLFAGVVGRHGLDPFNVYCAVREAVLDAIDDLTPGQKYGSSEFCGPELWAILDSRGLHSSIGICVSFLVKFGLAPLVCVTPAHLPNKRYSLTAFRSM